MDLFLVPIVASHFNMSMLIDKAAPGRAHVNAGPRHDESRPTNFGTLRITSSKLMHKLMYEDIRR
jgi:hypothetical protein